MNLSNNDSQKAQRSKMSFIMEPNIKINGCRVETHNESSEKSSCFVL